MKKTTGSFSRTFKKDKVLIKNLIFVVCLVVLSFQFIGSFNELISLIDENQPYIQVSHYGEPQVLLEGQMVLDEVLKKTTGSFVKTDTLKIYTYKLIQTILLLFGIFMCIIFMSINNKNFSLIELIERKKE